VADDIHTVKRKVAVIGIGETKYYKHGQAPVSEFRLVLEAITRAAEDAGIDVRSIDGYASYSNDRNEPARLAAAFGSPDLAFSNMVWGGGGGGGSGAMANATAALVAGYAKYVVVFRGLAQGQFGRFGQAAPSKTVSWPMSYTAPYGLMSAGQMFAMRVRRFMHDNHVGQAPMRAIAMASYHHAQTNPRAVMQGRPLSADDYDSSRWIVEPFHLFDCCMENDGAAAVILTTADRARDSKQKPAYVLAAAQGSDYRQAAPAHNAPDYGTSNFKTVAKRLYDMAGVQPSDMDVVQSYENFTGGVLMSLVEHGFCEAEQAEEVLTFDNLIAPSGGLPINTSGGNLAECYMHGLELVTEAVRQVRGTSTAQVPGAELSMVCSGPMVQPVSDLILAAGEG
jgi:acetyl-CoA acetyltransferase